MIVVLFQRLVVFNDLAVGVPQVVQKLYKLSDNGSALKQKVTGKSSHSQQGKQETLKYFHCAILYNPTD